MAITGKFAADFSEFYTAVRTAEASLRSFETDAAKVQTRLNSVSDAFSGRRILSEAAIAVKAVEEVGGATALTATEQKKVNALVSEAIAKYAALGQEAPDDMKALAEATTAVEKPTTGITTGMVALGTTIGNMAANAIAALGRLAIDGIGKAATALGDLVIEGAEVSDISSNFENLATAAGHVSETMLGVLRDGTRSTISDFDLMKTANSALAAGMNLTDAQFATLARGAYTLAQATGSDVKGGLDAMSDAMLTGRTRAIELMTGKIDLEAAETRYATAIGTTRDRLTDEELVEARREAILDAVAAATARVGAQTDDMGTRVEQAGAAWENFRQGLAKSIHDSPVLAAGFDAVAGALTKAFGGDQQQLIAKVSGAIVKGAMVAVDFGIAVVDMAKGAASAYGALMVPINAVIFGLVDLVTITSQGIAKMAELAASMPGVGDAFNATATAARAAATQWEGMRAQAQADVETAKRLASGQSVVHTTLTQVGAVLVDVRAAMATANAAMEQAATSSVSLATANTAATTATQGLTTATAAQAGATRRAAEDAATFLAQVEQFDAKTRSSMTVVSPIFQNIQYAVDETSAAAIRLDTTFRSVATAVREDVTPAVTALAPALADVSTQMDTAARSSLSWSEAMDAARAGLGTMTGQINVGKSLPLPYSASAQEWRTKATELGGELRFDDYNNPYVYYPGSGLAPGNLTPNSYATADTREKWGMGLAWRAEGGPVMPARPYIVGERGPELFIPQTSGTILPNGAANAAPITVTVTVNGTLLGTVDELARAVGEALVGRLRRQGVPLPAAGV